MRTRVILICLTLAVALLVTFGVTQTTASPTPPEVLLNSALRRAQAAGSYQVDMALDQSTIVDGAPQVAAESASTQLNVEASVAGSDRTRLTMEN
jgi:predicted secreted protein